MKQRTQSKMKRSVVCELRIYVNGVKRLFHLDCCKPIINPVQHTYVFVNCGAPAPLLCFIWNVTSCVESNK